MQNKHRKDEDALLKKKADERELLRKKKQNMQKGSNPTIPPLETDESVLIDTAIDYFYEQGINEEGLDLIIEEVGVDTFTDFIIDLPQQLDEERSATKAPKRDYAKVKAAVYKKDAARKEKGTGEYSTTKAAKAKYGDEEAPEGKVATATTKAKKVQPKKPATKQGLGDRIKSAYKAGVKRHRKATQGARVFHKGMKAGAKKAVKFAKDVHKAVNEDEVKGNENVKVNPKIGSTCEKCAGLLVDNCCQNCGHKQKVSESYSVVLERLGGKGYSRKAAASSVYPGKKGTGDWEDSDRGAGNKATRRAGGKVKAKSPTYAAWVKNKNVKEAKVDDVKYSKSEKLKDHSKDVHLIHANPGVRQDRNKRRNASDVVFRGHSTVERDRKQAHYKSRGVKKVKGVKEETVNELNRYGKETGKATGSLNKRPGSPVATKNEPDSAINTVRRSIRKDTGRPEGQQKKIKGQKPPVAGEYGARRSPADIILKRREDKKRAQASMMDTRGT